VDTGPSRRQLIAVACAGVIVGVVAVIATIVVMGSRTAAYTATAELAVQPAAALTPDNTKSVWSLIYDGQPSRVAADVLRQPKWVQDAAAKAGVSPDDLTVTSTVIAETTVTAVSVQAPNANAAEVATDAIVAAATPTIEQVAGPVKMQVIQAGKDTAKSTTISRTDILAIVFIAGFLLGAAVAYPIVRSSRREDEPQYANA
jgi:hypothetical protein